MGFCFEIFNCVLREMNQDFGYKEAIDSISSTLKLEIEYIEIP